MSAYAGEFTSDTGDGSAPTLSSGSTTIRESAMTSRTRAVTVAMVSPGRIRKFTTAVASGGSTLSLTPAESRVGAMVVWSSAAPSGDLRIIALTSGPVSQRLARAMRWPKGA